MEASRILLVDDEPLVRALMRRALSDLGFVLDDADDGVTAIERIRVRPDAYALMIIDLMMPRMLGDEAARRIRALAPGLKIVATSGVDPERNAMLFLESGTVDVFLPKPFRQNALRDTVTGLLPPLHELVLACSI